MDRHYRLQRHVYDWTRRYFLAGRLHLVEDLHPAEGSVLEIGCGTAWNLTQIARRYPEARLFGVDISRNMLATAAASLERKRLSHRIMLGHGDATSFDPVSVLGRKTFDRIVLSYAVSMIPNWEAALSHAAGLLAPGGSLHVIDFGQGEKLPGPVRQGLLRFLAHYSVTPRAALRERLADIADDHQDIKISSISLYKGYACYSVLERG